MSKSTDRRHRFQQAEQLRVALAAFSKNFHAKTVADKGNIISSPVGAWILLAHAAASNPAPLTEQQVAELEEALHMPLQKAGEFAHALITTPPEVIKASVAAWGQESHLRPEWVAGVQELGVGFEDRLPSKAELDDWVDEATLGIITEFPADVPPDTLLLLVNALATKVNWTEPFDETAEVGSWDRKELLLSGSGKEEHQKNLVSDEDGNVFLILTAESADQLRVHSVIADDPSLSREQVLAFAEGYTDGSAQFTYLHGANIPESVSGLYTVELSEGISDKYTVALPGWEAESKHDLIKEIGLPFATAGLAVTAEDFSVEAGQAAKAAFHKEGFEAAAVSYMLLRATGLPPRKRQVAKVAATYNHPYAVVASAVGTDTVWDRLPVFSAWIQA